jgi:hypothetical protein
MKPNLTDFPKPVVNGLPERIHSHRYDKWKRDFKAALLSKKKSEKTGNPVLASYAIGWNDALKEVLGVKEDSP